VAEPARVLGERYLLLRELGRGAMGVVWLARDELLHREVAVKQLLVPDEDAAGEARARAMREARIAARLHHPNAISVFDVVTEDGQLWLVMEYLPSRNLAEVLAGGVLAPAEAARVGARVAAGLAAAHELGIVHRDVKPGNILLGDKGIVKLADFGIARLSGDAAVTKTGVLTGTPAYLAPEVARGAAPEPPSDLFSLGATLYAAVEGAPPFGLGENHLALLHRVAAGEYTPPRQAGPLAGVLERLLAVDPRARPTAAEAAELLGVVELSAPQDPDATVAVAEPPTMLILGQLPPGGAGTWPSEVRRERRRLPRWLWPAATTALVVVALLVAIALNQDDVPGLPIAGVTSTSVTPSETTSQPAQTTTTEVPTTTVTTVTPTTVAVTRPTTTTQPPTPTTHVFTAAEVATFLRAHYAALPEDTATAWQNLTPEYRLPYPDYVAFWSGYDDVGLDGEPVVSGGGSAFSADIRIRFDPKNSTSTSVEPYRVRVVVRDGRLLLDQTTRLG
jgi:serine/threonine protein kinase